jgi:hypothetical protein
LEATRIMERLTLLALACSAGLLLAAVAAHQAGGAGAPVRDSGGDEVIRIAVPVDGIAECDPIVRDADGTLLTRCGDRHTRVLVEVKGDHRRILVVEPQDGSVARSATPPTPVPAPGQPPTVRRSDP